MENLIGVINKDICNGQEAFAIPVVNDIDDDTIDELEYMSNRQDVIDQDTHYDQQSCCSCEDGCVLDSCPCIKQSVLETDFRGCPYDQETKLLNAKFLVRGMIDTIKECSNNCYCRDTCANKLAQSGLRYKMGVKKTVDKGWSLIALENIPQGGFICEYVGEVLSEEQSDSRQDDSCYIFSVQSVAEDGKTYDIDAYSFGNIGRFINHSCDPNLISVQFFTHAKFGNRPRIAFFAEFDIKENEELSFNYGEDFWAVMCLDVYCKCGKEACQYNNDDKIEIFSQQFLRLQ